jgi:hypothetical protein
MLSLSLSLPIYSVPGQPEDWSEINLALLNAADPGLEERGWEGEEDSHKSHGTRQDRDAAPHQDLDQDNDQDQDQDLSAQDITDAFPWTNQVNLVRSLHISIAHASTA